MAYWYITYIKKHKYTDDITDMKINYTIHRNDDKNVFCLKDFMVRDVSKNHDTIIVLNWKEIDQESFDLLNESKQKYKHIMGGIYVRNGDYTGI